MGNLQVLFPMNQSFKLPLFINLQLQTLKQINSSKYSRSAGFFQTATYEIIRCAYFYKSIVEYIIVDLINPYITRQLYVKLSKQDL